MDFRDLQCHIYAQMRDEGGSIMNLATRLELCINNECRAVYEARYLDYHYWVRGNAFFMFRGRKTIQLGSLINKQRISFSRHEQLIEENLDRFELSSYDLGALLKHLHQAAGDYGEWIAVSIDKELAFWLEQPGDLDPFLLAFICSAEGDRRVYQPQLSE